MQRQETIDEKLTTDADKLSEYNYFRDPDLDFNYFSIVGQLSSELVITLHVKGASLSILKKIYSAGFSFNFCDEDGNTPLMIAILQKAKVCNLDAVKYKNIVIWLLETFELNLDLKNNAGHTALELAKQASDHEIINLLKQYMQHKVLLSTGKTALHFKAKIDETATKELTEKRKKIVRWH